MAKLTKHFIELEIEQPVTGQRFFRDEDIPGFAIRVTRRSKSYILEKRVGGSNRRITIGKWSEMSVESAKKLTVRPNISLVLLFSSFPILIG